MSRRRRGLRSSPLESKRPPCPDHPLHRTAGPLGEQGMLAALPMSRLLQSLQGASWDVDALAAPSAVYPPKHLLDKGSSTAPRAPGRPQRTQP